MLVVSASSSAGAQGSAAVLPLCFSNTQKEQDAVGAVMWNTALHPLQLSCPFSTACETLRGTHLQSWLHPKELKMFARPGVLTSHVPTHKITPVQTDFSVSLIQPMKLILPSAPRLLGEHTTEMKVSKIQLCL